MAKNILVTVGTSLLTNKVSGVPDIEAKFKNGKDKDLSNLIINRVFPVNNDTLRNFKDKYLVLEYEKEIKNRFTPNKKDNLAAEISSLFLFYYHYENGDFKPNEKNIPKNDIKDNIYLICSETPDSIFCGLIIKEFLESNEKFKAYIQNIEELKVVKGLKLGDNDKFNPEGIDQLINDCADILKEGDLINISGGYKVIGPYLAILSMCIPNTRTFYLYEKATEVLELPRLAIDMDILLWRDYRGITAILPRIPHLSEKALESFLPSEAIRGLFNNKCELNRFGEILKNRYEKQKSSKITEFGSGFILSDRLKKIDGKLGEKMEKLIHHWQHLWLGDTLRETVEHSRGHVQRLQEIAAQILFQIFEYKPDFLNEKDLFKLICAIWLHDIGHSSESFTIKLPDEKEKRNYNFPGFPTITRDLHHFISASLIEKEKKDIFTDFNISDNYLKDIIDICRYHRKKMPAKKEKPYNEYGLIWKKPIEEFNENMQFLISLFSLIDESDVQQERAYPENYRLWRERQNKREENILCKQFSNYFNALTDKSEEIKRLLNPDNKINVKPENLLDKFSEFTFNNEYLKNVDKAVEKHIIKLFIEEGFFNESKSLTRDEIVYCDILSIVNRFLFKKRQPDHFEKHKGVLSVGYVLKSEKIDDKRDNFNFDVYLTFSDDNEYCQNAAKDIYTQYYLRKGFLNKKGFYLKNDCFRFININDSQKPIESRWGIQDAFDESGEYKPEIIPESKL